MARSIQLGTSHNYASKKEATDAIQAFVARKENKESINPSSEDGEFVMQILNHHPNKFDKIGSGIVYFFIDLNLHGTRSFYIHRTDGSNQSFSWTDIIKNFGK